MRFLEHLVHSTGGVVMTPGEPASLVLDLALFHDWIRTSKAEMGDAAWEAVHGLLMALQKQAGGAVERLAVGPWAERANFPNADALLARAADIAQASSWRKDRQLIANGFLARKGNVVVVPRTTRKGRNLHFRIGIGFCPETEDTTYGLWLICFNNFSRKGWAIMSHGIGSTMKLMNGHADEYGHSYHGEYGILQRY